MRSSGSVLIVVLGLLAILAVIGITFVTMSNLDRRTAVNFAIQSQFMLAADGAVDYVCHHLVQDLWRYDAGTHHYVEQLLTDSNTGIYIVRNEPYDYPNAQVDPWLATSVEDPTPAGFHYSYGNQTGTFFGLTSWGTTTLSTERPNNLGLPLAGNVIPRYTTGTGHGVWIPDLSFPFDVGLIRTSVTVQDHGAMVNLNAHGRLTAGGQVPEQNQRFGYYVGDVDLEYFGFQSTEVLDGTRTPPGLWRYNNRPYNDFLMQPVIENPARYGDRPFTLDEEFELRRLTGTYYLSRLESFNSAIEGDPSSSSYAATRSGRRLSLTTVGWTSEVQPDPNVTPARRANRPRPDTRTLTQPITWSARKIDLNLDDPAAIGQALSEGNVFQSGDTALASQFAANICAFRDGTPTPAGESAIRYYNDLQRSGASPQPIISKVEETHKNITQGGKPMREYTIKVQVISPWPGDVADDYSGLTVEGISLNAEGGQAFDPAFPATKMAGEAPAPAEPAPHPFVSETKVVTDMNTKLSLVLKGIALMARVGSMTRTIDELDEGDIDDLEDNSALHRKICIEYEHRVPDDLCPVRVVYIAVESSGAPDDDGGEWFTGTGGSIDAFTNDTAARGKIPIRFPRSVVNRSRQSGQMPRKGLPPVKVDSPVNIPSFRAFARAGDLNRVLCQNQQEVIDNKEFWPWVPRVAKRSAEADADVQLDTHTVTFNWRDASLTSVSRQNAANVFCVGGPWLDGIDNDGDGMFDEDGAVCGPQDDTAFIAPPFLSNYSDEGTGAVNQVAGGGQPALIQDDRGRSGGPELRVAGKINLNTATSDTLAALARGVGLQSQQSIVVNAVKNARASGALRSPAQIVSQPGPTGTDWEDARGVLERRDLLYTRISNIASARGDTFSIYGTVQYGHVEQVQPVTSPPTFRYEVVRSRRFWALVDRSPSCAYCPMVLRGGTTDQYITNRNFIRPRILNFQWID